MINNMENINNSLKRILNCSGVVLHQNQYDFMLTVDVVFQYKVDKRDVNNDLQFVNQILSKYNKDCLNSDLVQSMVSELKIQLEQKDREIIDLRVEKQELEKYKTFYDLYKDLKNV